MQKNSADDARFERNDAKAGEYSFNLKTTNGQVIGTSESYNTVAARDNGIASVAKNAVGATIVDLTK